jgi:hypothetical protein
MGSISILRKQLITDYRSVTHNQYSGCTVFHERQLFFDGPT